MMNGVAVARRSQRFGTPLVFFVLAAVAVCLGFIFYTHEVWEDYFITFRFSKNLCEGKGLVYNDHDRVHGFTSPLGVLLPALCYTVTGRGDYLPALWLFRCLSIAAYAGAGSLILRLLLGQASPWLTGVFFALLYLLDVKAVAFATNGMETGFMLLFVAWGLWLLPQGAEAWLARGLCWAGLMWTRPDGCIYIAALAIAQLVYGPAPRARMIGSLIRSGLVCTLVYGPWFLWAKRYYGSPVPNTVAAKATYLGGTYRQYFERLFRALPVTFARKTESIFAPIYYTSFWGWPDWVGAAWCVVGVWGCIYWVLPLEDRLGRAVSVGFVVLCLYNLVIPVLFPWYLPPIALCGLFLLARGVPRVAESFLGQRPLARMVAGALLGLVVIGSAVQFALTAYQVEIQQRVIEDHNRIPIGLWLKEHAKRSDLVYLESLGYIGYFSGCRMADYPGLISPAVVRVRHEDNFFVSPIFFLWPDWIVARPEQAADLHLAGLTQFYRAVKTFDVSKELEAYPYIPGRSYLTYDTKFIVFRKRAGQGAGGSGGDRG